MKNILKSACIAAALLTSAGQASAQIAYPTPPAELETPSPGSVDLQSGILNIALPGLSAGDGVSSISLQYTLRSSDTVGTTYSLPIRSNWDRVANHIMDAFDGDPRNGFTHIFTIPIEGGILEDFQKFGTLGGTYTASIPNGASVNYSGGFNYTSRFGVERTFDSQAYDMTRDEPNGVHYDISPRNASVWQIRSNTGWAIVVEQVAQSQPSGAYRPTKACIVNLATTYLGSSSGCPTGVPAVTFGYTSDKLTSYTDATGATYTFSYDANGLMSCMKEPGQSSCKVTNSYDTCYTGSLAAGNARRVVSQTFADGSTIGYSYSMQNCQTGVTNGQTVMTQSGAGTTTIQFSGVRPSSVTNPVGRVTTQGNPWPADPNTQVYSKSWYPGYVQQYEGNKVQYSYDTRGNVTTVTQVAKSGSGLANIVSSATYPADCSSTPITVCNKPLTTTDGRGNVTTYTYSTTHGSVLTKTEPADANGVHPQTRYTYTQRYAWLKTSGGGYAQSATPVYLLTSEEFCRTSAPSGSSCAGGASDEVVTTYDYGPNSGPNNLLLRGKVVTSNGVSHRTCYQRDTYGRVIAETLPNANLSSCS